MDKDKIYELSRLYDDTKDESILELINNLGGEYVPAIIEEQPKDEEKSIKVDVTKIDENSNDPEVLFNTGLAYLRGEGVDEDEDKAFVLFNKVEQIDPYHFNNIEYLRRCYRNGWGCEINEEKQYEYTRKLADLGDSNSMNSYGYYLQQKGDNVGALGYYRLAAENGSEYGYYNVAVFYDEGIVGEVNLEKAFDNYLEAANRGHAHSMGIVGYNGFILGWPINGKNYVDIDVNKGIEYLKKSVSLNPDSNYAFEKLYLIYGVNYGSYGIQPDFNYANECLEKSFQNGSKTAKFWMGLDLLAGDVGRNPNVDEGIRLLKELDEIDYIDATKELADIYRYGKHGIKQDFFEAFGYYNKGDRLNDCNSTYALGVFYEYGYGISPDYEKALEYYLKAANQENVDAFYALYSIYSNDHEIQNHKNMNIEPDVQKAAYYLNKAVDQGNGVALYSLGNAYEKGLYGFEQSDEKALQCFKESSEKNYYGTVKMAEIYENGQFGVQVDKNKAYELYADVADHSKMQYSDFCSIKAGFLLLNQDSFGPDQYEKAADYIAKGYFVGNIENNINLVGELYCKSNKNEKAEDIYKIGIEKGYASCKNNYAWNILLYGGDPTQENVLTARNLIQEAANSGYVPAYSHLAFIYDEIINNDTEAVKWYQKDIDENTSSRLHSLYRIGIIYFIHHEKSDAEIMQLFGLTREQFNRQARESLRAAFFGYKYQDEVDKKSLTDAANALMKFYVYQATSSDDFETMKNDIDNIINENTNKRKISPEYAYFALGNAHLPYSFTKKMFVYEFEEDIYKAREYFKKAYECATDDTLEKACYDLYNYIDGEIRQKENAERLGQQQSQSNYTSQSSSTSSGGCYIATAVYGSYDCPEVWTLRRFRDYKLAKSLLGRTFIKCYYATSPTVVKWFGHTKWFNSIWKNYLDKMVKKLKEEGFEDTPYND